MLKSSEYSAYHVHQVVYVEWFDELADKVGIFGFVWLVGRERSSHQDYRELGKSGIIGNGGQHTPSTDVISQFDVEQNEMGGRFSQQVKSRLNRCCFQSLIASGIQIDSYILRNVGLIFNDQYC